MSWVHRKGSGELLRSPRFSNDSRVFTIEMHHGGTFRWGVETTYEGGKVSYFDNCNPVEMSYLQVIAMAETLGCNGVKKLFFMKPISELSVDLCELKSDQDAIGLMGFTNQAKVVEVYCDCVGDVLDNLDSSGDEDDDDYNVDDDEGVLDDFTDSDKEINLEDELSNVRIEGKKSKKSQGEGNAEVIGTKKNPEIVNVNPEGSIPQGEGNAMDHGYVSSDGFNSDCDSDDDNEQTTKKIVFSKNDLGKVKFSVGMLFGSGQEFTRGVKMYVLQQSRDVFFKITCRQKKIVLCADENCSLRLYASKLRDEETYQVKILTDKHTCNTALVNRSAKPKLIADLYFSRIKINPWWKLRAFRDQVGVDLEIKISTITAFRALNHAKAKLQGTSAEQYTLPLSYLAEIKRANPCTTAIMKFKDHQGENDESRFSRLYICWGAMKRGFYKGCRPIIGLDGCHLTGPHKGVMLTAVALDPNNCMYPFAYAIVDQEKYTTWKWFMKLLRADLNIVRPEIYTIMSDKQKGLIKAAVKNLPGVEHRFCVRHLYNNFKGQHKGLLLKDLVWKAARATTKEHFQQALSEIKEINPAAFEWLSLIPPEQWSRSHFEEKSKCDVLINNMCESFNGCIKEAKGEAILTMLDSVRCFLMDLMMRKNEAMKKYNGEICPKINQKLEKIKKKSHEWIPKWNGVNGFEVDGIRSGERYDVLLDKKECGCNKWQMSGLPCVHALSAIGRQKKQTSHFVHECYMKSTYIKTYSNTLMPINGRELWQKVERVVVLPPIVEKKKGKPQKARRRGPDEPLPTSEETQSLSRKGRVMRCKTCKKDGHNSRTCGRTPKTGARPKSAEKQSNEPPKTATNLVDESTDSESDGDHYGIPVFVQQEEVQYSQQRDVPLFVQSLRVEPLTENMNSEREVQRDDSVIPSDDTWLEAMKLDAMGIPSGSGPDVKKNRERRQADIDEESWWSKLPSQEVLLSMGSETYNKGQEHVESQEHVETNHVGKKRVKQTQKNLTPTRRSGRLGEKWPKRAKLVDTTVHDINSSDDDENNMEPPTQESVNTHGGVFKLVDEPNMDEEAPTSSKCHAGIYDKPVEHNYIASCHYERGGNHFISLAALKKMAKKK